MNRIPVTILTGFLGSGKTSLLSRVLRDPRFSDTSVVINEFGEVGLDHMLVEAAPEAIIEMTSGCLCCTVRGDIRHTLLMLQERSERGEIPMFSRLVVETTGLADPAPVIHTLMVDPRLARRFSLARIVTVVDAVNGLATLKAHPEAVKQAAVADVLVLSKTDLAQDTEALRTELQTLNPSAIRLEAASASMDLRAVIADDGVYQPHMKAADVTVWLGAEAVADGEHHHDHTSHHEHDVNRHSESIRAYCLVLDKPMSRFAFSVAMELLAANQGEDLLRFKAIVGLAEEPDRPIVVHGVQHIMHPPLQLEAWPDNDRRSKLVFITRNIPKATLEQFFAAWGDVSMPMALQ